MISRELAYINRLVENVINELKVTALSTLSDDKDSTSRTRLAEVSVLSQRTPSVYLQTNPCLGLQDLKKKHTLPAARFIWFLAGRTQLEIVFEKTEPNLKLNCIGLYFNFELGSL